jgi:hypothetical protein
MIDYSATDDGKVQGDGTASEHVAGLLFSFYQEFTSNTFFTYTLLTENHHFGTYI